MPRTAPDNAEPLILSPEDADLADTFVFRRTYADDGSIKYVQVVGYAEELEAAATGQKVDPLTVDRTRQTQVSLPRLIAQRMIGRPLDSTEVVRWKNDNHGDNRRANLEVMTRSELRALSRTPLSASGVRYVYPTDSGRYSAVVDNIYLGTYNTVRQGEDAVERYHSLIAKGVDSEEAAEKVKALAKMQPRRQTNVLIQS